MFKTLKYLFYHIFILKKFFLLCTLIIILATYSISLSINLIADRSIMYREYKKILNCSVDDIYEIDMSQYGFMYPDRVFFDHIEKYTDDLFDLNDSYTHVGGMIIDDDACYIDKTILPYFCFFDTENNKINSIENGCIYLGYSKRNEIQIGEYIDICGKKYKVQGYLKKNSYVIAPNLTNFDKFYLDDYIFGEMEASYASRGDKETVDFNRISDLFVVSDVPDISEIIKKIADNNNIILNDVVKMSEKQSLYRRIFETNKSAEFNYAIALFVVSIVSLLIISYIILENSSYRFWVMIMNGFLRSEILTIILSEIFLRELVSFLVGAIYLYYTLMIEEDLNELRYYIIPLIVIEVIMLIVQFIFSRKIFSYKIEKVANGGKC